MRKSNIDPFPKVWGLQIKTDFKPPPHLIMFFVLPLMKFFSRGGMLRNIYIYLQKICQFCALQILQPSLAGVPDADGS